MAATKRQAPSVVEEYLMSFPEEMRAALQTLRETIRSVVPNAAEKISYQIPTFMHHGATRRLRRLQRPLRLLRDRPALMEAHAEELKGYATNKASIRFDPAKPLPKALVKKLVKARAAENEELSTQH